MTLLGGLPVQLSNHPRYVPLASAVRETVESGQIAGLNSIITLAEILTIPAKAEDRQALQDYELYLTHFPNLSMLAMDTALAQETALVRATTSLRTPDAIQVAAARLARADAIVTNHRRWAGKVTNPALVILYDYVA